MTRYVTLVAMALLILAAGCSKKNEKNQNSIKNEEKRQIIDLTGRQVLLPVPLDRVALFGGPTGQIALLLRADRRLCAVTNTFRLSPLVKEFFPHLTRLPAPRTVNGSVNLEELIASRPQLVVAGQTDGQLVERRTDIPVAYFEDSMDNGREAIIRDVRFYADIFQEKERADRYVAWLDRIQGLLTERLKEIPETERFSVYNGFSMTHLVTLGGDTFFDEHIRLAGCRNAAASVTTVGKREGLHSGLGEVSMEQVLAWNPALMVIDMGDIDTLKRDARWSSIEAVRQGRIHMLPSGFFIWNRPTAESAALYPLWLAFTAYPERLSDLSLTEEIKTFYQEIFGVSLDDGHVARLLTGGYRPMMMKGKI